jgi:hypothetical protein
MPQAIEIENSIQATRLGALAWAERGPERGLRACAGPRRRRSRSEHGGGRVAAEMLVAFRRARRGCARFSFRVWPGSRSAHRVAGGCTCDSSRCRIQRPPAPARCVFAAKRLTQTLASSRSRSTDRAGRSATTETADPDPRRRPTSTNAAMAAVFAPDDAGGAQRRC